MSANATDPAADPHEAPCGARELFDVPADVCYLNTANLAPLLHTVRDAGERALARRARPWTITAEDWFAEVERLRELMGRLLGDADGSGVALVPSTSYGLATVAAGLRAEPGAEVVVLAEEYPSGIYTWRRFSRRHGTRLVTVERRGGTWTEALLAAIGERTAVVSVPQVHWTDGSWIDLTAVAARAHDVGAALVLDASQSLGAVPLDVTALRPAAVVAVGYKWLLGPFGRAYLWIAPALRDGEPLEENWIVRAGAEDLSRLVDYVEEYQPGARRFDHGERTQFEITPMALAGIEQLLDWRVEQVASRLEAVTDTIVRRLAPLGLAPDRHPRGPHIVGFELPDATRAEVLPVLARAGCHAAVRGSRLRLAPHRHVDGHDVDRLVDALRRVL